MSLKPRIPYRWPALLAASGFAPVSGQMIASRAFNFGFDIVEHLVHR